ncbi:hypothetical protein Cpir12675_004292 [Ceratocystis pirilliformis]|uniref:Ams2/SPT21 N-terminal domain-containing protein n=1 Tax=Ceratocystis pirilliformis TaxID=259994 RepID=A0ABR3YXU5_9PEZI
MTSPASNWQPAGQDPFRDGEMAVKVQQMGLKVHYTFDKLDQTRCLARLPQLIQVQTLYLDEKTTVGIVDLSLCLNAVAQGSPELINACTNPNSTIDYAVYVHDYSEPEAPLVGHGMLSGLVKSQDADGTDNLAMVTGLVTRNMLAMFGKGVSHTLEVKMKFSESQKVPLITLRQTATMAASSEIQPYIENALTSAGNAEWAMLVQSNPQLTAQLPHVPTPQQSHIPSIETTSRGQSPSVVPSRVASPAVASRLSRQNSFSLPTQRQLSRQGTPVDTPTSIQQKPTAEGATPIDTTANRPPSRTSRKRGTTGRPRGRPRKNPTPSEPNGNTSGYEEGTDDDPPLKRRATTMAVAKTVNSPFSSVPESLRVAASTSGSIRTFRPVGTPEPSATGHLQDVPRAPTPVPFGDNIRPRVSGSLRRTSTLNHEQSNSQLSVVQHEDARSPNELSVGAPTPLSEASTPDFGSSPPMPRTAQYLQHSSPTPSSPILPPMPPSTNDSGFMSGGLDDFPEDNRTTPRASSRKPANIMCRDKLVPVHVFRAASGEPVDYKGSENSHAKRKRAGTLTPGSNPAVMAAGPPPPRPHYPQQAPKMLLPRLQPAPQLPDHTTQSLLLPVACNEPSSSHNGTPNTPAQHRVEAHDSDATPVQQHLHPQIPNDQRLSQPSLEKDSQGQSDAHVEPLVETSQPDRTNATTMPDLNFDLTTDLNMFSVADESLLALGDAISFDKALADIHAQQSQTPLTDIMEPLPVTQATDIPKEQRAQQPAVTPSADNIQQPLTKTSASRKPSKRKVPSPSTSTPHPTSFSEAPCPPSDVAVLLLPPAATTSPPTARFNKNYVKKQAIKERLEQAIQNGEMPPFCNNCGAIETPTWRKVFVRECMGTPVYHEYSDKPGRVTAIEVTSRDDDQTPTGYRLMKKALGPEDDKTQWRDNLLCNPCGIWLCKNNKHRPKDRWEKDAERLGQERRRRGTGRAPVRKRKTASASFAMNNMSNYPVPTSESNIMTDPLAPNDNLSPIPEAQVASRTVTANNTTMGISSIDAVLSNSGPTICQSVNSAPSASDSATQSQPSTAAPTPENEDFSGLGQTQRLLFPSQGNNNVKKDATQIHNGTSQSSVANTAPNQIDIDVQDRQPGNENRIGAEEPAIKMLATSQPTLDDEIEALFSNGSPASTINSPFTPPPPERSGVGFKTPSRPTPSHRPVTRSVSRSLRSEKSSQHSRTSPEAMPQTPSRTPKSSAISGLRVAESPSLRRSPRINRISRESGRRVLSIGGKHVEASMNDIDAALAEFSRSINDDVSSRQQNGDGSTTTLESLTNQWSPNKDWNSIFDVDMLHSLPQEDLDLLTKSLETSHGDAAV